MSDNTTTIVVIVFIIVAAPSSAHPYHTIMVITSTNAILGSALYAQP